MKKKLIILGFLMPLFIAGCNSGGSSTSSNTSSNSQSESSTSATTSQTSQGSSQTGSTSGTPTASTSASPTVIPVSSVSLNKSSIEVYDDDSTFSLIATVLPANATNKEVTWTSSNPEAASVYNGSVTPVGEGTSKITVTTVDGNKTAECMVTVNKRVTIPNYVLHGQFDGDSQWSDKPLVNNPYSTTEYMILGVSLKANDVFKIHMYGEAWYGYSHLKTSVPSNLVTAASSDDNIKVLTTGVYDIYCDYNESDGGHIYLARVDVPGTVSVTGISLSHSGKFLLVRNEFTITPTVYPLNATNKAVSWTSSDTSIATVTSSGRVLASVNSKVGSTIITARTEDGNFTATCVVYVSASQYPDYCLTGTVGGRSYSGISSRYAAIPLGSGNYLIPDVELVKNDQITVTDNYGARLRDRYNQIYVKSVDRNMSVNVYLNINDVNKDYLSFSPKS